MKNQTITTMLKNAKATENNVIKMQLILDTLVKINETELEFGYILYTEKYSKSLMKKFYELLLLEYSRWLGITICNNEQYIENNNHFERFVSKLDCIESFAVLDTCVIPNVDISIEWLEAFIEVYKLKHITITSCGEVELGIF